TGWFLKWLQSEGDGSPVAEPPLRIPAWDLPELRCFPAGENRPAGPGLVALAKRVSAKPAGEADENSWLESLLGIGQIPLPAAPDLLREGSPLFFRPMMAAQPSAPQRVAWRMLDGVVVPAILLRPKGPVRGALL